MHSTLCCDYNIFVPGVRRAVEIRPPQFWSPTWLKIHFPILPLLQTLTEEWSKRNVKCLKLLGYDLPTFRLSMKLCYYSAHFCGSRKSIQCMWTLCYKTPVSSTRFHNRCIVLCEECVAETVNIKSARFFHIRLYCTCAYVYNKTVQYFLYLAVIIWLTG